MTSTAEPQKSGLPGWLKIVLIVGTVFVIGAIGLFAACTMMLKNIQDPQHVKQIATTFMNISDPPGGGFEYALGIDFGAKLVGFVNKQKNLSICIATFPESKDLDNPEQALNKMDKMTRTGGGLSGGASTTASSGASGTKKKFEATNKGTEKVGGREMSYAVGYEINSDGSKAPTFIGLFPPGPKGSVCIFGQSPGGKYDMDSTNDLLKSINSI
jgi:hypothetical protein